MKKRPEDELAALAALVRDRELRKVETVMREVSRIAGEASALSAARAERLGSGTLDAARMSGAERVWLAQTQDQLGRARMAEAALRARHEAALRQARIAFGRADVAARLAKRR